MSSSTQLFLCEKPSQGRDIARVLGANQRGDGFLSGNGIIVTWCIGHILETAPPDAYDPALKKWALTQLPIVPDRWRMVVKSDTEKQFKIIKKLLGETSTVVIATDADREGEMIAREVLDFCGYKGAIQRLWLSALNDASVRKALSSLKAGHETFPLYHSALGRSRADWLIGMNLSRLFTLLGQKSGYDGVLSVGRVQTPTLKLVVDRERAVASFIPVPYWAIEVELTSASQSFKSLWQTPKEHADDQGRCLQQQIATAAAETLRQTDQVQVTHVETKRIKEAHPLPYELSELQKVCSAKFGLGAQQTLDIAQSLYEKHKVTSYPRTDCGYLPESMQSDVSKVLAAMARTDSAMAPLIAKLDPTLKSRAWNEAKVAEAAHHGIIPTEEAANYSAMSDDEKSVYDVIRRRYLAQFAPLHEFDHTEALFSGAGQVLKATGKRIIVSGWKAIVSGQDLDNTSESKSQVLPALQQGQMCSIEDVMLNALKTNPPSLFTEGTLIDAMKNVARLVSDERLKQKLKETTGIGTNATRAGIIQGLIDRKYLIKKNRSLISSDAAKTLIESVPAAVSDPGTTAIWEQALEMIEKGQMSLDAFVQKQAQWISQLIERHRGTVLPIKVAATPTCPLCRSPMRKRRSEKGEFWGCGQYPHCKGMQAIERSKKSSSTRHKKAARTTE